tara:strand:+ start:596 stop:1708 length:1113 start_codon:yes stop_codon:yes gene_type:complete
MNINHRKVSYIAEINLCSKSAYKHQVLKMCDTISELGYDLTLYIISSSHIPFAEIKKQHLLKKNFKIEPLFKEKKKLNFFLRLIFFIKLFLKKDISSSIIYSRSVLISIFFSLIGRKSYLEIHQINTGLTFYIFNFLKKIIIKKIRFILISENLNKHFLLPNNNYLIAEDGVDIRDFQIKNNVNLRDKLSCVYTGSLFKGKGLEFIYSLAKKEKDINFFIYGDIITGDKNLINKCKLIKNLHLKGFVDYNHIPRILKSHPIILMPYEKKVYGNHRTANLSDYMSPLKMFDYLASGQVIISSKNYNINKIIKNGYNGIICNNLDIDEWSKKIRSSFKDKNLIKILQKNSYLTAKRFTWKERVHKILSFINS